MPTPTSKLHKAVCSRNAKAVLSLLDEGEDVDQTDSYGWSALHWAAREGFNDIVVELILKDADVDAEDHYNQTPLHLSAICGHTIVTITLMGNGVDINARGRHRATPLQEAIKNHHVELALCLIGSGADLNKRNKRQDAALHIACQIGLLNIVQVLIGKGADVNLTNKNKETPLHYAVIEGHVEVTLALLKAGSHVNAIDAKEYTPIHFASLFGQSKTLLNLLRYNGDVNAVNHNGQMALHLAVTKEHLEVVILLIEKGAMVNATDDSDITPLHLVCDNEKEDVALFLTLVDNDADVGARDVTGDTPLHLAALRGHLTFCHLLLKHGADFDAANSKGARPWEYLTKSALGELIQMMVNVHRNNTVCSVVENEVPACSVQEEDNVPKDEDIHKRFQEVSKLVGTMGRSSTVRSKILEEEFDFLHEAFVQRDDVHQHQMVQKDRMISRLKERMVRMESFSHKVKGYSEIHSDGKIVMKDDLEHRKNGSPKVLRSTPNRREKCQSKTGQVENHETHNTAEVDHHVAKNMLQGQEDTSTCNVFTSTFARQWKGNHIPGLSDPMEVNQVQCQKSLSDTILGLSPRVVGHHDVPSMYQVQAETSTGSVVARTPNRRTKSRFNSVANHDVDNMLQGQDDLSTCNVFTSTFARLWKGNHIPGLSDLVEVNQVQRRDSLSGALGFSSPVMDNHEIPVPKNMHQAELTTDNYYSSKWPDGHIPFLSDSEHVHVNLEPTQETLSDARTSSHDMDNEDAIQPTAQNDKGQSSIYEYQDSNLPTTLELFDVTDSPINQVEGPTVSYFGGNSLSPSAIPRLINNQITSNVKREFETRKINVEESLLSSNATQVESEIPRKSVSDIVNFSTSTPDLQTDLQTSLITNIKLELGGDLDLSDTDFRQDLVLKPNEKEDISDCTVRISKLKKRNLPQPASVKRRMNAARVAKRQQRFEASFVKVKEEPV